MLIPDNKYLCISLSQNSYPNFGNNSFLKMVPHSSKYIPEAEDIQILPLWTLFSPGDCFLFFHGLSG